jgi:BASS family bile acid:Na+ symporter
MKKNNIYKAVMGAACLFLLAFLIMLFTGNVAKSGPALIGFFILLSFGVKGYDALKGYTYTAWVFAGVTAAMFYPQPFISIGSFKVTTLVVPLLQIIMFGMGSQMSLNDFTGVLKMPKGVILGVFSHFLFMPLMAFIITIVFRFPPEIAAGIILIGCTPSGLASNVMSFIAKANLALAVTIGATTTILSPFVTPLLMKFIGGQYIEVNLLKMMLDIFDMMILPIIAGFIFNLFNERKESLRVKIIQMSGFFLVILIASILTAIYRDYGLSRFFVVLGKSIGIFYLLPILVAELFRYYLKGDKKAMSETLAFLSKFGIVLILAVTAAPGRDALLNVGVLMLVLSIVHIGSGFLFGYTVGWLFKLPEQDRRVLTFETGMPNGGLGSGLAMQMGKIATVGLGPLIWGSLMNVVGSILANYWQIRPPKTVKAENEIVEEKMVS